MVYVQAGRSGVRISLPAWTLAVACLWGAVARGEPTNAPAFPPNGDFETADASGKAPAGWDRPDGLGVQWTSPPEGDTRAGAKAIRMDTSLSERQMVARWRAEGITKWDIPNPSDGTVAATYGLSLYSHAVPVVTGQAYRVTFDFRADGESNGGKLWVRGYGQYRGERRRRYETIVFCRVPDDQWHSFTQVFYPAQRRPEVTEMQVMLYAYWPPGVYWFDNVRIEPISIEEYHGAHRTPREGAVCVLRPATGRLLPP